MAKRGTNEGSIFQRKDGRWVGSLNLGWENGKRKRRHFYAASAAEVRDELLKARSDQSHGLPVSVDRQTVKDSPTFDASTTVDRAYQKHFHSYYDDVRPGDQL